MEITPTGAAPQKNVLMGILAYIGPLVLVPFLVAKEDPFVKFHVKQGLVLLIIEVSLWILAGILWIVAPIVAIIDIGILILIIIGIVNVLAGKEKELPLVGSFAKHFSF